MSTIESTLDELVNAYTGSRRAGHTTAMMNGARHNPDVVVLTHDHQSAEMLKRDFPGVTVRSIRPPLEWLKGRHAPLLLDNGAIVRLCMEASQRIRQLLESLRRTAEEAKTLRAERDAARQDERLTANHAMTLQGENDALRAAVQLVEWACAAPFHCPWCAADKPEPHLASCQAAALLGWPRVESPS